MKAQIQIYGAFILLVILVISCSKQDEPNISNPQQDTLLLTDKETSRNFPDEGGTWQINFTASMEWTAEQVIPIAVQWYHFTPRQGKAGAGSVTVTVLPNTTDETRSAEIRLSAGRAEQIVTLTQRAGHVELTTETEVRAFLERLYHDTDGENWRFNANWCSDKPISEWDGVRYENGAAEPLARRKVPQGADRPLGMYGARRAALCKKQPHENRRVGVPAAQGVRLHQQ